jgi:hypothetical protein
MKSPILTHRGFCDASGAAALDDERFVAAGDEDNWLRVYHARRSGAYVTKIDVSDYLALDPRKPKRESDIEAAASIDGVFYWITSHGANRRGKRRPARRNFFAMRMKMDGNRLLHEQVGHPYTTLLNDLIADQRYERFSLRNAARIAPKKRGGLNIEGLCDTPEGHVLIGFRNPIRNERALVVPLLNPSGVVHDQSAQFGDPIELPLGGLGIRSVERIADRYYYLIVAGHRRHNRRFELYRWSGAAESRPERLKGIKLRGLNPEAIVTYPGIADEIQIISDDGSERRGGTACKKLPPKKRKCRSLWVPLP